MFNGQETGSKIYIECYWIECSIWQKNQRALKNKIGSSQKIRFIIKNQLVEFKHSMIR